MKKLALIFAITLLAACSDKQASNTPPSTNQEVKRLTPTPPSPTTEDLGKPGKPATDGKTLQGLYESLKQKGWQFTELKESIRIYDSEETQMTSDENKRRYIFLRYENEEKAGAAFEKVKEFYSSQRGNVLRSRNFIVATFNPAIASLHSTEELPAEALEKLKKDVEQY